MDTTVEKIGEVVVVKMPNEYLDASNVKAFRRKVEPVIEGNIRVIFDLSPLKFIDSAGLGVFLSCLRHLHARGGDLKLCNMTRPVRVLFELIRAHRVFQIFDTRASAVSAFIY